MYLMIFVQYRQMKRQFCDAYCSQTYEVCDIIHVHFKMNFRRADVKDIPGIKQLIKGGFGRDDMERALKRRYGDGFSLNYLIDTCPLSLVSLNNNDEINGFLALSMNPPEHLPLVTVRDPLGELPDTQFYLPTSDWDTWIKQNYKCPNAKINNMAFLNFFCSDQDSAISIFEKAFSIIFDMLPSLQMIAYFLPDSLILFPPLSSNRPILPLDEKTKLSRCRLKKTKISSNFFTECIASTQCTYPFSLHACHRKEFCPSFDVRLARVEDCDDLVPILKRNHLLDNGHEDQYVSSLLETESPTVKSLVAEVDGQVVAFMSISRDVDQEKLRESYRLQPFHQLIKIPQTSTQVNGKQLSILFDNSINISKSNHVTSKENVAEPETQPDITPEDSIEDDIVPEIEEPSEEKLSQSNVFIVTLMCVETKYSAYASQLIQFGFQIWPDLEYCALTLAPGTPETSLMRYCSPIPSVSPEIEDRLYLTNRFTLKEPVEVKLATPQHLNSILNLAVSIKGMKEFRQLVTSQFTPDPESEEKSLTYVALAAGQVIGAVVLSYCNERTAEALLDQYDVASFFNVNWKPIEGNYSIAKYLLINPLFECQTRYICFEIMRMLKLNCILYPKNQLVEDLATKRLTIREFIPVKPRRMIEYPNNLRDDIPVPPNILGNLQMFSMQSLYEPRMVVDTRIVVVGGSDTGISFLETLIYMSHIQFSNLTLISNDGIPDVVDGWLVDNRSYTSLSLKQHAIDYYARIITDSTVELHREHKKVTISSESTIKYDYLVLCPGLQYYSDILEPGFGAVDGVFAVNNQELPDFMSYIEFNKASQGKIVIYGRSLQAYMAIEYCIMNQIPPARIYFVDPTTSKGSSAFPKEAVNELVQEKLKLHGIPVHQNYTFDSYQTNDGYITAISFLDKNSRKVFVSNVDIFLYADQKSIHINSFKTINDACLVYDGALVIDKDFRTTDPFIFGAGTATKYATAEKTDWLPSMYSSKEIGNRLAWVMMHFFDPNVHPLSLTEEKRKYTYRDSLKRRANLPGGLKYFSFDMPKLPNFKPDPLSRNLEITVPNMEYSCIHVDQRGYIQAFEYIGPRDIPMSNLECLYSRHEKYFNRLIARFDEGVIPDFIPFFNETWALCLFHDRFPAFIQKSRADGLVLENETTKIMVELRKNHKKMNERDLEAIYDRFDQSPDREEWNKSVFDYLLKTQVFKQW
ncbi:hypothetical protein BC833DRAFT_599595 [Globomyces pollinis-pini]|nr:hypothetical protein BC833DRAFT_599595 [Globomyces pollinis-pini]